MSSPILQVNDLSTYFFTRRGVFCAVDGVGFVINEGETLGLVGETGCGKSMTALSVLRLVPPPGRIVEGEVLFKGRDLLQLTEGEMREVRGAEIAMIFQDPMSSLNPVFTVGDQIGEAMILHRAVSKRDLSSKVVELLDKVGIPLASRRKNDYPHQFSGGMRQRVMIAMSLSCSPSLLIADEPTTALDVTIQAQILELIKDLRKSLSMTVLLITHNLGVIAEQCDRVAVMYAGNIIETAGVEAIFDAPLHPYTVGLINCIPRLDVYQERLEAIPGTLPNILGVAKGCKFEPRCRYAGSQCRAERPRLMEVEPGHSVACFRAGGEGGNFDA